MSDPVDLFKTAERMKIMDAFAIALAPAVYTRCCGAKDSDSMYKHIYDIAEIMANERERRFKKATSSTPD